MMERVVDPLVLQRRRETNVSFVVGFAIMVALFAVAPFVAYPVFLMQALCFALFACAFNLLIGYVGLVSFGHALYFGWASYLAAYAAKTWHFQPELAILTGTATAAVLGIIAGGVAIRRQGIYFAMITLALAQMMYFFALRAPFTGGEDGIQAVPRGRLFGYFDLSNEMTMYVFVLVVVLAAFLLIYRIINSPFGEVLKAIRENEQRTISLGYNTDRYKLVVFVLSATLAGLAGSLKALVFQLASLTDVHWTMSGDVLLMTLLGGLGTVFGPVVGAFAVIAMQNYLAPFGQWVLVIQGVIFVVCVLVFRRGIIGELAAFPARATVSAGADFNTIKENPMSAEARLKELGIVLPSLGKPVANYLPYRLAGNILYLAGQGPRDESGKQLTGKLGKDISVEEGYRRARLVGLRPPCRHARRAGLARPGRLHRQAFGHGQRRAGFQRLAEGHQRLLRPVRRGVRRRRPPRPLGGRQRHAAEPDLGRDRGHRRGQAVSAAMSRRIRFARNYPQAHCQ